MDPDIKNRIDQLDRDLKLYVDMKMRAIKRQFAPFIWMKNNPWKTIIGLVILFMLSAFLFHLIDIKQTIENKTGVSFKLDESTTVDRPAKK